MNFSYQVERSTIKGKKEENARTGQPEGIEIEEMISLHNKEGLDRNDLLGSRGLLDNIELPNKRECRDKKEGLSTDKTYKEEDLKK